MFHGSSDTQPPTEQGGAAISVQYITVYNPAEWIGVYGFYFNLDLFGAWDFVFVRVCSRT